MIIGIGGASTSGKSWLATKIKSRNSDKKVKILCQDDFVLASSQLPEINGHVAGKCQGLLTSTGILKLSFVVISVTIS